MSKQYQQKPRLRFLLVLKLLIFLIMWYNIDMQNKFKKVTKVIRSFFITDEKNTVPRVYATKALVSYGMVVMFVVAILLPFYNSNFNSFFAQLTQNAIIAEVNPAREVQNLLPLKTNEQLNLAASLKAQDMIDKNYFSHNDPNGQRPWMWLDSVGYKYALAGENLAKDFFDVSPLITAWFNSPSHARNIFNDYFTEIGIGIASGEIDGQETTVVVMFVARPITPVLETILAQKKQEIPVSITETTIETLVPLIAEEEVLGENTNSESPLPQQRGISANSEQILRENIVQEEYLQRVPSPNKLFVVQKIANDILQEENNLIQQGVKQKIQELASNNFILYMQGFFLNKLPNLFKIMMSAFLVILLAWLLIGAYILRYAIPNFMSRTAVLAFLILILWI